MKNRYLGVLSVAAAATLLYSFAQADVVEEPLLNPVDESDVWGKKITGLGAAGDETALVFTKTGETMNWTLPDGVRSIWYLVVGGGGSGGTSYADTNSGGGGGGAGGMVEKQDVEIASRDISVSVGKGGAAVKATSNTAEKRPAGNTGDNSSLTIDGTAITAHGGGGGGGFGSKSGKTGGSGGGAYANNAVGACMSGEGYSGGQGTGTKCGGGGGGGAGGPGGNTSSAAGGKGGPGEISLIGGGHVALVKDDSGNDYYCAGGGGGSGSTSSGGAGGIGGGGRGNVYSSSAATTSGSGSNYGCGGGGTQGPQWKTHTSGAGYQGVVVVRYRVMAANEVIVPTVTGSTYNGEHQRADIADGDGYYVLSNEGGSEAGDYVVTLVLSNGCQWVGGSTDATNLTFTIAKAENGWVSAPSLTKTAWELADDPATVNAGAARSGTEVMVTYDEGDEEMPLSVGSHTAFFTVAESQNYHELAKTVSYTVSKNTNVWTVEPTLTKTAWAFDEEAGLVVDGAPKYGEVVVTYDADPSLGDLPTTRGAHTVKFAVAEGDTYTGLEKVIAYTVTKKQHTWTVKPSVPSSVNVEDGVDFPMPKAEQEVEVAIYYDGDPEKTELTELAAGETHTVTYAIAGDDDWDAMAQTFAFKVVYKAIVDQADPSKVLGYRISKLGVDQNEVALVFTNTGYTADNPMSWTLPQEVAEISYLVVGGGGGGGGRVGSYAAGGGGAGGVVSNDNVAVFGALSIVVGNGGSGCTMPRPYNNKSGESSLLVIGDGQTVTAYGGGKGGCAAAGTGGENFGSGGGGGSTASGGAYVGFAGGAAGQGFAGGAGANSTYRGGGGGGAGEAGWTPSSERSGKGGDGIVSAITGGEVWYAGGGGGGSQTNGGIASPGGKGGGGAGGACASNADASGQDATYYGGGGGSAKGQANGGSGYQGVVIVRYVEPAGAVMVPTILSKVYTGEPLTADVPANVGYTVTENAGGTEVGEYTVALTLNAGYHWDGGSTASVYLVFAITPAQNEWTVEPSITKATWLTTDEPGVLTSGVTKFGRLAATIAKDGATPESFGGTLPTAPGRYVITYAVEASDNWLNPEVEEKSIGFQIVSGDSVPPFTVTKDDVTTIVGDGQVGLSVGYAVHSEVESPKTVDIYAYIAEDGSDTTNDVQIAEGVALDATGSGVLADLKPGAKYWVALGGRGGDTVAPVEPFAAVTVAGPATGLSASATFSNNPKEFVVTGTVTPGLGTTTVYLRWSLNSSALDNLATYSFAHGDAGAFTNRVQYVDPTDTLTWDVAVSNSFTSTTHGEQAWSAVLPASTRTRADQVATTYTWTGAGENNDWANAENWETDRSDCFGYPDNEVYAKARVTRTVTINLGGKTFAVVKGGALILNENSGDVVTLTNGTLRAEYEGDGDFGAAGTTIVFRDATLNRTRLNPTTKGGMTTIFEGQSRLTGMVRPWNATDTKIVFRNGDITIGGNLGNGSAKGGTEVIVSNATVTVQGQATSSWGPGIFPVKLQNGPDRQARILHTNNSGFDFVQSPYTLAIPAEPYATPYLQAVKSGAFATHSPTFKIDVTNWKRGRRVPILTFTDSASGAAAQYGGATVQVFENGIDVTDERHARLEWNEARRTLYYRQDGQFGYKVIIR